MFPEMDISVRQFDRHITHAIEAHQDIREFCINSPFRLQKKSISRHPKLEKYSDTYRKRKKSSLSLEELLVDSEFFPQELVKAEKIAPLKSRKRKRTASTIKREKQAELQKAFSAFEKSQSHIDQEKELIVAEEVESDQEYIEENLSEDEEEENDYIESHFDNGEVDDFDDGGDDDDGGIY